MQDLSRWMWVSTKPGQHEAAAEVSTRRVGRDVRLDRGDAAVAMPMSNGASVAAGDACMAQHEVERHGYCAASARPR